MFVVFDLDGTLADIEHRRHLVTNGNRKWDQFFAECVNDTPIEPVIKTLRTFVEAGHTVQIWSGRSDQVWHETVSWLREHVGYYEIGLIMRTAGDYTPDDQLKEQWIDLMGKPDMVFDDRQKVVDMWRRNGIVCAQVAPGDF